MRKTVLIVGGPDVDTRFHLEPVIESLTCYRTAYLGKSDLEETTLFDEYRFDACIFDCVALGQNELEIVQQLSSLTSNAPILILANQVALSSYDRVHSLQNAVTLQKPFDVRNFEGLLEKVAAGKDFKPKVCPRFATDEEARMMQLRTGLLIPTRMRNYSAGGAFLEYRGISLQVGDEIHISLTCRDLRVVKETFQARAKVIWISDGEDARSPARGVGVQFVNSCPLK
ncbi:MAG: PilZ domain-containing protein [Bdellovibrionia bacterium]